jgi:hypothetical protein
MQCLGARRYNLGPGPGSLTRFKKQFARNTTSYPGPLTVVLKEDWFKFWWQAVFPVARALRPILRRIVFQRSSVKISWKMFEKLREIRGKRMTNAGPPPLIN